MPDQQQASRSIGDALYRVDQLVEGGEIEALFPIGNDIAAITVNHFLERFAHADGGGGKHGIEAQAGVAHMPADGAGGTPPLRVQRAIEIARDAAIISRFGVAQQRQPFHAIPGAVSFAR